MGNGVCEKMLLRLVLSEKDSERFQMSTNTTYDLYRIFPQGIADVADSLIKKTVSKTFNLPNDALDSYFIVHLRQDNTVAIRP